MEISPRYNFKLLADAIDEKYALLNKLYQDGAELPSIDTLNKYCNFYHNNLDRVKQKTLDDVVDHDDTFLPYLFEFKYCNTLEEMEIFWKKVFYYEVAFGVISNVFEVEYRQLQEIF